MEVNRLVNRLGGVTSIEKTLAIELGVAAPSLTTLAHRGFLFKASGVGDIFVRSRSRLTHFCASPLTSGFVVAAACYDSPYAPPSTAMPAAQIALNLMQVSTCEESIWP